MSLFGGNMSSVTELETRSLDLGRADTFTRFHFPMPAGTDRRAHRRELVWAECLVSPPVGLSDPTRALMVDRSEGGALIEWPLSHELRVGDHVTVTESGACWTGRVVRVSGDGRPRPAFALARLASDRVTPANRNAFQ